jgi:protein O-GlcNAc transferase
MRTNEKLFQDAVACVNTGRFSDAERAFKTILRSEPAHVGALNLLTIVLLSMRRYDEAEDFARAAINVNQNSDVTFLITVLF